MGFESLGPSCPVSLHEERLRGRGRFVCLFFFYGNWLCNDSVGPTPLLNKMKSFIKIFGNFIINDVKTVSFC